MRIRQPNVLVFDGLFDELSEGDSDASRIPNPRLKFSQPAYLPDWPARSDGAFVAAAPANAKVRPELYDPADAADQPSTDPDVIAQELGLHLELSASDLGEARRQFALRNHPDLVPEAWRAAATDRMAIANLLIDAELHRRSAR